MADSPKTVAGGTAPILTTPPELPDDAAPIDAAIPGTIQLRPGESPNSLPPAMPTLSGSALPQIVPASSPPPRYELAAEIARGGMGRVVEAVDTVLGRVVALKEALSFDPDSIRRFQRETKITARLEHPSIVPVHDAGTTASGMPFYVMRKISGRPLESLVASAHTVSERLALIPHLVAAAQAVAHAHVRGIVHRDIKPANILVGELGETIVIDWGLAKVIGEADEITHGVSGPTDDLIKTRVGIVFGTPGFMSPEQLRGAPVDERCDVYALGATLYHVLSRKPPHHAKTADAMMLAAVTGPPPPLAELGIGVPPELSTIVDKALAYDPAQRYQDARALAGDLQQFLTGQLVASHHYTAKERVIRFVRRHRVPVIAISVALLALGVGGAIAVNRVVNERDRADESARIAVAEKRQAEERTDQLALTQARILVQTNPTLALALVRPLALKYWREVRGIAAAARVAGVPWSLPGSPGSTSVEFTRDGQRALIAGTDGVVRVYDLAARTAKIIARRTVPVRAQFAAGERSVVVFHGTHLELLDLADLTAPPRRALEVASPIATLAIVDTTAYWVDTAQLVWQLELARAGSLPEQLVIDEPITGILPSPDGHWLALAGERHLLMKDRTETTTDLIEVMTGMVKATTWSADGHHLAALIDQKAIAVAMLPRPSIQERLDVGTRFGVAFTDTLYALGPTGLGSVTFGAPTLRKQLPGSALGMREARRATLVAPGAAGTVHVISEDGDHVLHLPVPKLLALDASPHSPYVIATVEDRLLVWNLDEIQPRRATPTVPSGAGFVTGDQLVAAFVDGPGQWIDLATGRITPLGTLPAIRAVVGSPDGTLAVIVDLAHHARVIGPGREPIELPGEVDRVGFLADRRLVSFGPQGVRLHDLASGRDVPLAAPVAPLGVAWHPGGWVAATFADGSVWRHAVATGKAETITLATKPTTPPIVYADGTVALGVQTEVQVWRPDGSRATLGAVPKPIVEIAPAGPAHTLVFDGDAATYLAALATAGPVTRIHALGSKAASMAASGELLVALDREGGVELVDPLAKQHWLLSAAVGATFASPTLSPDGKRVLATTAAGLVVWTLDLPVGAAATAKWLDVITNAERTSDGELIWR